MPLGFFTTPYPDELLYSVCARFAERIRYPSANRVSWDLFGNEKIAAIVDLPNKLDNLIGALVEGHNFTADQFIDNHTLYPLYAPFLPLDRSQSIRDEMKGDADNRIRTMLGVTSSGIPLPSHLRFCPMCVNMDREKYGETYWHRIHQITGVDVCPKHAVFLVPGTAPWQENKRGAARFLSAESHVHAALPVTLEANNMRHTARLRIASAAAWLLNWHGPYVSKNGLHNRYHNLLLARGYAHYNGHIKTTKLIRDFIGFYSQDFLKELHCPLFSTARCWLLRVLLRNKVAVAQHPLRHLLLMIFMNCSPEQVFSSFVEYKPFGEGPWPCLNRASEHFGDTRVTECRITASLVKGNPGRPRGTFRCECGFTYSRVGPDTTEDDRLRYDSVKDYGHVWEQKLQRLWKSPSSTFVQMAEELGFGVATIIRRAVYLGLAYPRDGRAETQDKQSLPRHYRNVREQPQKILQSRRQQWLDLRAANPDATRKQLLEIAPYLHFWLRENDREWYEANAPLRRQFKRHGRLVDWAAADPELSTKVIDAATRIKNKAGKPNQASLAAVIREVGHQAWLELRLDKLPLTAQAITEHVETLEAYQIRKVRWAASYFLKEGVYPTRHQLMVKATVRNATGRTPPVQSVIDSEMEKLTAELPSPVKRR